MTVFHIFKITFCARVLPKIAPSLFIRELNYKEKENNLRKALKMSILQAFIFYFMRGKFINIYYITCLRSKIKY